MMTGGHQLKHSYTAYDKISSESIQDQHDCLLLMTAAVPDVLQKDLLALEAAVAESAEADEGVIRHLLGLCQHLPDGRLHLLTA